MVIINHHIASAFIYLLEFTEVKKTILTSFFIQFEPLPPILQKSGTLKSKRFTGYRKVAFF